MKRGAHSDSTTSLDSLPAGRPCSTDECMEAATAHLQRAGLEDVPQAVSQAGPARPAAAGELPPGAGKAAPSSAAEGAARSPVSTLSAATTSPPTSPPSSRSPPAAASPPARGRVSFADEPAVSPPEQLRVTRSDSEDSVGRAAQYDESINEEAAGIQVIPRASGGLLTVSTGARWEAVVGYSRAVRKGPFVYVSGTSAVEQATGRVMFRRDAYKQARLAFTIIERAMEKLGAGLNDVVRTRLYLRDMARDSEGVSRAHGEVLGNVRPASSMIQVSRLVHDDILVLIEVDAVLGQYEG